MANDYDFDEAQRLYFEEVKKRAETESKTQVAIVLEDLGYYFRLLTPSKDFQRDEDGRQQFWSLIDERDSPNLSKQTALMMFRSSAFSSNEGLDNPFLSLDAETLFEFL